ncbi:transcription factor bHLH91-like [Vigna angularis]|uniref:transcription factor bHLH91-like n=1 Tax=Phaseolus angularis TaxID=3914 RepID=UPI0022B4BA41|nr:transcription factor bHLH91-like [Vigna angularis]
MYETLEDPNMYEESSCFDPNGMVAKDYFSQMVSKSEAVMSVTSMQPQNTLRMENLAYTSSSGEDASAVAMEIIAHPQQNSYNQVNNLNPQFVQVVNNHGSCEELYSFPSHSSALERGHHDHQFPYSTPTPDLLNLLHLSMTFENQSTNLPKLSGPMGTADSTNVSIVSYDPFLHLNLQAPPPALGNDFAFGGGGIIQGSGIAYQDFGNGVVEFTQDVGKKRGGERTNQFTSTTTERQRRVDLSSKFDALIELIPNPSKRHCPGYAASSMPRRPISSLDNGSLQLSHPPPSSAQNSAKRYKKKGST